MYAAWRLEENGIDEWLSERFSPRSRALVKSALIGISEILTAPKECIQRLFYRPKCHIVTLSSHSKPLNLKKDMTQKYLKNCTEILYRTTNQVHRHEQNLLDTKTVDDLSACVQGIPSLKDGIFDPQNHLEVGSLKHLRPLEANSGVGDFGATSTGTYVRFAEFHKWHKATAPNTDKRSGAFSHLDPDRNPDGLQHFINTNARRYV